MPSNSAAWLPSAGSPLAIGPAEMPTPDANSLIIANRAIAINPVDWKQAASGFFIQSWPTLLGCDTAGTVHSVGSAVTNFSPGDRVLAHCIGIKSGDNADEAFQMYSRVPAELTSRIPDHVSFEDAAVIPLGLSTAAAGLYEAQNLGLPLPKHSPMDSGKTILIWGGSSSVGSSAIQLAVASGLTVVTTASEHNFSFCEKLGAAKVFDHRSGSVVGDVVAELSKGQFAGAYDAIGLPTLQIVDIVAQLGGGHIATVLEPPPAEGIPSTVEVTRVFGIPTGNGNTVGKSIYHDFLPQALKSGQFKPMPPAEVVGEGLDTIQGAMDELKKGVSAKKIVVKL